MRVISLFCGAGGMDYGFLKAGHTIVWANDHDKDSLETYRNNICKKFNLPEDHVVLGDIEKIDTKEIPDGDIVIGGFPCQGFYPKNTEKL